MPEAEDYKALSVRQPWAHAILHLGKDVENRPMRTHYRGVILIQASLKVEREKARKLNLDPETLPTGVLLGSVEIVGCVQDSESKWAIPGQWHWVLENPRVLSKLIPWRGKLGFMRIPTSALEGVEFLKP